MTMAEWQIPPGKTEEPSTSAISIGNNLLGSSTAPCDIAGQIPADILFNALINVSPMGMYIIQNGKFQFISRSFTEILGFSLEDVVGCQALTFVHPEDRELVRNNAIAALKSGSCKPYEYRVNSKNGELKWVLETVVSVNTKNQRAVLGSFMDVTERKTAREQMRQANEKLSVLVQKLEKQNRLNSILTEMRDLLQACSTIEEIPLIIVSSMKKLFPEARGALFLMSPSRSDLESVARWGDFPADVDNNVFTPDACWGLRRGHAHVVEDAEAGPICLHLKLQPKTPYICLPLMAKGDVLGLLHIRSADCVSPADKERVIADIKDTAVTISEYLSLAIANIKLSESLSRQSIQDLLSGLYNRRYMEESLEREIQRAARKRTRIGIVMADLDHFKTFNDKYGHVAGDIVITHVGKLLKQGIRGTDIACRYGGEEFVLIFPDCSAGDAFQRADSLREKIKKLEIMYQGQVLGWITISMGVSLYPDNGASVDDLIRTADVALYKAKQAGRDQVIAINP
jgi:diguanylate cyclase (GGDEF)-like protein/PAS domain S-box-containing protein